MECPPAIPQRAQSDVDAETRESLASHEPDGPQCSVKQKTVTKKMKVEHGHPKLSSDLHMYIKPQACLCTHTTLQLRKKKIDFNNKSSPCHR